MVVLWLFVSRGVRCIEIRVETHEFLARDFGSFGLIRDCRRFRAVLRRVYLDLWSFLRCHGA